MLEDVDCRDLWTKISLAEVVLGDECWGEGESEDVGLGGGGRRSG